MDQRQIAAVINLSLTDRHNNEKVYVSIAVFIELGSRGKVIKWRSFTSS